MFIENTDYEVKSCVTEEKIIISANDWNRDEKSGEKDSKKSVIGGFGGSCFQSFESGEFEFLLTNVFLSLLNRQKEVVVVVVVVIR